MKQTFGWSMIDGTKNRAIPIHMAWPSTKLSNLRVVLKRKAKAMKLIYNTNPQNKTEGFYKRGLQGEKRCLPLLT